MGTKFLQFLPFLLLIGACAASTKNALPPTVQLTGLRLGAVGMLSQELKLDLKVGNPNDFSLPLDGLTFKLEVNGNHLADGFSDQRVSVPRLGYATVTVIATTDTLSVIRQLLTIGQSDALDYSISGVAYFSRLGVRRTVPYARSGSVSLLPGLRPGATPAQSRPPTDEIHTLVPL